MKANLQSLSTLDASRILYVDNHVLVVNKPAGLLTQSDASGEPNLHDLAKAWVKVAYHKPGQAFLGLVHRLDKPVSGIVVLARTSKAAARLSEQFRNRRVRKTYWAIVEGRAPKHAELVSRIIRTPDRVRLTQDGGQLARLLFRKLASTRAWTWLEIELGTGRHHQIRAQLAAVGHPILGDKRYGAHLAFADGIALHARELVFEHPTRKEDMRFTAPLSQAWQPYEYVCGAMGIAL